MVLKGQKQDFLWTTNLYLLAEFLFISAYYRKRIFQNNTAFYSVVTILSTLFIITTIIRGTRNINSESAAILFFTAYFIYGIRGLYVIVQEQKVIFLGKSSFFWSNVAFITFFPGNFLVFLLINYLLQHDGKHLLTQLWILHDLLNALKNVFLGISLFHKNHQIES